LSGELENFYTVVSKIRTLAYSKLAILPIEEGIAKAINCYLSKEDA